MKKRMTVLLMLLLLAAFPAAGRAEALVAEETLQEGYTEETEGYLSRVAWCENGEESIFGKFYFPKDFDGSKQYPVIIMSHGVGVTHSIFEKGQWVDFAAANGYVSYAFDFCGSSERSLSSMDMADMTIDTEKSDLNAVLDFVKGQPFVDKDYIFLMGQSFGGFISAIAAPDRDSEVRGMILLYPAICAVDMVREMFPSDKDIPKEGGELFKVAHPKAYFKAIYKLELEGTMKRFHGKVLLIHGEEDPTVPIAYSERAAEEIYAEGQAELLTITGKGSTHAFELFNEEGRALAQEGAKAFLEGLCKPYRKVACVGDSITYGMLRGPKGDFTQFDNYPQKLGALLGEDWKVCNYGQPGAHVTRDGEKLCYWDLRQFTESREKKAEVVIIMLGTNDSVAWDAARYEESLGELVDAYREGNPDARIVLMICPSVYPNPATGAVFGNINAGILDEEVPGIVTEIAQEKGTELVDLHTFTADHPEWFADGVHPNGEGHDHIAAYLYEQIFGSAEQGEG